MRRQHTNVRSTRLYSKPVKIDVHRSGALVIRVSDQPPDDATLLLLSVDTIEQAETLRLRAGAVDPKGQPTYRLNLRLRQGKEQLDLEDSRAARLGNACAPRVEATDGRGRYRLAS